MIKTLPIQIDDDETRFAHGDAAREASLFIQGKTRASLGTERMERPVSG